MEVTSLREPKMADRVATVLRKMFIRGEIPVGTMLPPESELMEQFGVSRPTLREAFRVLESESLIQMQRGVRGGARVTSPTKQTLARYAGLILEYEGVTLKDVYDARASLEADMIRKLAVERDPETLAALEAALRPANGEMSDEQSRLALAEFHIAIATLCGNKTLQMVNEMLYHLIARATRTMRPTGTRAEQAWKRSMKAHAQVVELIEAGDADGAVAFWRSHLERTEKDALTGPALSTVVDLLD
ncbi:MAG TPA: FCD domain-containing protein [Mycobacterium sp.]|nr:FCD domain-containing protein [Mycobacterium sp.]